MTTLPFTIRLPETLHAKLKAQASEQTRSMSQQVEHIVRDWFGETTRQQAAIDRLQDSPGPLAWAAHDLLEDMTSTVKQAALRAALTAYDGPSRPHLPDHIDAAEWDPRAIGTIADLTEMLRLLALRGSDHCPHPECRAKQWTAQGETEGPYHLDGCPLDALLRKVDRDLGPIHGTER